MSSPIPGYKKWSNEIENIETKVVIDRGRTDFSLDWNGLSPRDKILIYCYYYMEMHTISGFHVFQRGCQDHQLNFFENLVFLDFGCGPLTSAIALAWHYLAEHSKFGGNRLLIRYVGIDRSEAMMAHALEAHTIGGLFHAHSTFDFMTPTKSLELIPPLIGRYRSTLKGKDLTIVLNCSYLFASRQLRVGGLITFVSSLVKDHFSHDKVCLVFQNPDSDGLNVKWEQFKKSVHDLRGLSQDSEVIHFIDFAGQTRKIRLRREFLLNRKWLASGDIIPF